MPAGHVYVIRFISAVNFSVTLSTVIRVSIGSAVTPANRFYRRPLGPEVMVFDEVRIPMVAGEFCGGFQDAAVSGSLTIAGYDFVEP